MIVLAFMAALVWIALAALMGPRRGDQLSAGQVLALALALALMAGGMLPGW